MMPQKISRLEVQTDVARFAGQLNMLLALDKMKFMRVSVLTLREICCVTRWVFESLQKHLMRTQGMAGLFRCAVYGLGFVNS